MIFGNVPVVPATYWGHHLNNPLITPNPVFTYNTVRLWDAYPAAAEVDPSGCTWATIEPTEGNKTWTFFDSVVAQYVSRGKQIVYPIGGFDYQPAWACPGSQSGKVTTAKLTAWVTSVCNRFITTNGVAPGDLIIEPWSEPNGSYAGSGGTIADMVTMAQTIYNAAKAVSSSIRVLSPAVSNFDPASSSNAGALWFNSFLLAGGGSYFDIAAMHSYSSSAASTETLLDAIDNFTQTCNARGLVNVEKWSTEGGMNWVGLSDVDDQAAYVAKYHLFHWARGIKRVIWYSADNLFSPQYYGRLFDIGDASNTTSTLRKAGTAMVEVRKWMQDAAISGRPDITASVCSIPISRPGGYRALALYTANRSTPTYSTTGFTQTHDLDGTKNASLGATITLGYKPILLETGDGF